VKEIQSTRPWEKIDHPVEERRRRTLLSQRLSSSKTNRLPRIPFTGIVLVAKGSSGHGQDKLLGRESGGLGGGREWKMEEGTGGQEGEREKGKVKRDNEAGSRHLY